MIDFEKLQLQEIQELQNIITKNVEKSELERSYLYTHDTVEKAKIYIWCYRFLYSIRNLTKPGILKQVLDEELDRNTDTYIQVANLLNRVEKGFFNRHRNLERLRTLILVEDEVDDMIDCFAVLLEKTNVLSMSRLKGFVLEGQSGKDFKRLFDSAKDKSSIELDYDPPEPELENSVQEKETNDQKELEPVQEQEVMPEASPMTVDDAKEFMGEGVMIEEVEAQFDITANTNENENGE